MACKIRHENKKTTIVFTPGTGGMGWVRLMFTFVEVANISLEGSKIIF